MRDDRLYLIHIKECIQRIEKYTFGGRDVFMSSSLIQDAVIRNLQIMAESSQRISDAMQNKHPEVEWLKIAGFRNLLVHDYLGVDLEKVWNIVEGDLPGLTRAVTAMFNELG
jgi:uncharacterized protein with HEPN domain